MLFKQQEGILSGASVIGVMVLLSAILGLVRKRLYAGVLGAGGEYDVLVAAFKIPDLIFQLLVAGSLNAAFIPLFSRYIMQDKAERAWKFASAVINLTLLFFLFFAILGFVLAPQLSFWLAPGFSLSQRNLLIKLMRIIFISPMLLGISSFLGGVVQSFRRFALPFLSPVVYNLGAIAGIMFLYPPLGIEGMVWGVVVGSVLHLLVVIPLLKHLGFKFYFCLSRQDPALKELIRLALPRTVWVGVYQIKEVVVTNLASVLAKGSISVLDYGQAIIRLPVLVLGASIGQASLPTLSEYAERNEMDKFRKIFAHSFLQILFLVMPISAVFVVLKIPLVRLVFGTGKFAWWETVLTAWVVALLGISLFAQALNELIVRGFYAIKETDPPVFVGVSSIIFSILLAMLLVPQWTVRGIAFSYSVAFLAEFVVLFVLFSRKVKLRVVDWVPAALKIIFAAFVMAGSMYFPVKILDQVFIDTTQVVNLVVLVWVVLTFGGCVYLLITWILGCKEIKVLVEMMLKLRGLGGSIFPVPDLPRGPVSLETEEMEGVE